MWQVRCDASGDFGEQLLGERLDGSEQSLLPSCWAAWPNAAPIDHPLELLGPVGGLLGIALGFAQWPIGGV